MSARLCLVGFAGSKVIGMAPPGLVDGDDAHRAERHVTFQEYAERWRLAREVGWAVGTRKRVESNLRCHLYPVFGDRPPRTITPTSVLEWLTLRLVENTPPSSLKLYFELLDTVLAAAVVDKVATENPCDGVKLSQILRGLNKTPKWVPIESEVMDLFGTVPERYRAALWLGAGQGCRISEVLGMENSTRCIEPDHGELHIVQQLGYSPKVHGGFYLSGPKSGSSGTVDLDPVVGEAVAHHIRRFPPVDIELVDTTAGERRVEWCRCCSRRSTATRSRTARGPGNGSAGVTQRAGRRNTAPSTRCGTSSPPR
jgi:integrase